jgi:hypothetical protein
MWGGVSEGSYPIDIIGVDLVAATKMHPISVTSRNILKD